MDAAPAPPPCMCTLHHSPVSLYSLMARFAFVLGQALNPATAPRLEVRLVHLHYEENYSEQYLTQVNHKGEVPALTSPHLEAPILESRDIGAWLCERQPELLPTEHRETIRRLVDKMYAHHANALLVAPEVRKDGLPNKAAAMLENPWLSRAHRRALEVKSVFHDTHYSRTLEPENVLLAEIEARDFMADLSKLLRARGDESKTWIFGDKPTILDAHAAVLASRLLDRQRFDLIPDTVRRYAEGVQITDEWKHATHVWPTPWEEFLDYAADLDLL